MEKFIQLLADPKFRNLFETFVKTATNAEEKSVIIHNYPNNLIELTKEIPCRFPFDKKSRRFY